MKNYTPTSEQLPEDGQIVMTKISDYDGERNECLLRRQRNLWFAPSRDMHVYYAPTHWRSATADELEAVRKTLAAKESETQRLIFLVDAQIGCNSLD